MRQAVGNLLKLAVVCGLAFMVYEWQSGSGADGEAAAFAERACLDEARSRYDVSNARAYEVARSSRGYVVRVAATLTRGKRVRITCVANEHGGINDIEIDER